MLLSLSPPPPLEQIILAQKVGSVVLTPLAVPTKDLLQLYRQLLDSFFMWILPQEVCVCTVGRRLRNCALTARTSAGLPAPQLWTQSVSLVDSP
jgi:hypothetical protein